MQCHCEKGHNRVNQLHTLFAQWFINGLIYCRLSWISHFWRFDTTFCFHKHAECYEEQCKDSAVFVLSKIGKNVNLHRKRFNLFKTYKFPNISLRENI